MKPYPELWPADIGAVKGGRGIPQRLSERWVMPHTDRFHFFVIGDYLPWDDDYVILESIGKGIAVGRLSFYRSEDVEVYRVPLMDPEVDADLELELREMATAWLTLVGRAGYDYLIYLRIAVGAVNLLLHGKRPPWLPGQFKYGKNSEYLCTEAAVAVVNWLAAAVGQPMVIPDDVCPFPACFKQALDDGELELIYPLEHLFGGV